MQRRDMWQRLLDVRRDGAVEESKRSGELFERLWLLRRCYSLRSSYDAVGVLTTADAIAHGERLMRVAHWQERRAWRRPSERLA
jgi:hypothetical protein